MCKRVNECIVEITVEQPHHVELPDRLQHIHKQVLRAVLLKQKPDAIQHALIVRLVLLLQIAQVPDEKDGPADHDAHHKARIEDGRGAVRGTVTRHPQVGSDE
jgi:hypothetical protein